MSNKKTKDTPEQAEFRVYCRQWLEGNHPGEPPAPLSGLSAIPNGL